MTSPKLLIVDDDPGVRAQIKWAVQGFDIITADSRQLAIELFDAYQPPLVTLDLGLPPNEDGTSEGYAILMQILRQAPQTRVLIVSGSDSQENSVLAKKNGAYGFYSKPIDVDDLQRHIDMAYADYIKVCE